MTRRMLSRLFAALVIVGAASAQAFEKKNDYVYPRPPAEGSSDRSRSSSRDYDRSGDKDSAVNLQAVGGVSDITGGVGGQFNPGPVLGVQVSGEAAKLFEVEAGYQASRHGIDNFSVGDDQALYRHNVGLFAKVGPEIRDVRPFVGAGLGASYINVSDGAEGSYRNDFFQEIPLGAGIEYEGRSFTAGVRGTWSSLFNDEFAEPTAASDNPDSNLVTGLLHVGGKF